MKLLLSLYTECILNTVFIPLCSQTLAACRRLSAEKFRCEKIYIFWQSL